MQVFKFCSLDIWALRNIYYSQLFFSEIHDLNDAGECLFNIINDLNDSELNGDQFNKIVKKVIILQPELEDVFIHYYRSLRDHGRNLKEVCAHIVNAVLKKYRSCSFTDSEGLFNPIMWGHYGNSNRGICIRYELNEAEMQKISYVSDNEIEKIKTSEIISSDIISIANRVFYKKNENWKYEREYRIIQNDSLRDIPRENMTGIFFGSNASVEDAGFLYDIVKEKYGNVDFAITYHTRLNNRMINQYFPNKDLLIKGLRKANCSKDFGTRYLVEESLSKKLKKTQE